MALSCGSQQRDGASCKAGLRKMPGLWSVQCRLRFCIQLVLLGQHARSHAMKAACEWVKRRLDASEMCGGSDPGARAPLWAGPDEVGAEHPPG